MGEGSMEYFLEENRFARNQRTDQLCITISRKYPVSLPSLSNLLMYLSYLFPQGIFTFFLSLPACLPVCLHFFLFTPISF